MRSAEQGNAGYGTDKSVPYSRERIYAFRGKEEIMQEVLKDLEESVAEAILQRHRAIVDGYEVRIREGQLQQAVTAAGGRNYIAIRALVGDLPQDEEGARAAVRRVKRENPYLFGGPVTAPGTGSGTVSGDYTMEELGKLTPAEYRRYRKGS